MKAAVLWELDKDLEVRDDLGVCRVGPSDVRVRLVASGVCHSDVSAQNGTIPTSLPCVLGHEGAGVIEEVGSSVRDLAVGDHVILSFVPACRRCRACLRGQSNLCERMLPALAAPRFELAGRPAFGFLGCGTFSEQLVLGEDSVVRVDSGIPLDVVSLIGCGVTTGVGAAIHTAGIEPGSSVCVIGCGGVGIAAIQGARIAGAAEILAVDALPEKIEAAKRFGATHGAAPEELPATALALTGGEGFDYALECVGSPQTIRAAFDAVRRGGTAVVVGVGRPQQKIELNAFEIFYSEKTLKGSVYGSANVRVDFPRLLRLWKQGRLDLESMITRRIELEEINDALRAVRSGEVIRSVVCF